MCMSQGQGGSGQTLFLLPNFTSQAEVSEGAEGGLECG